MNQDFIRRVKEGKVICNRCKETIAREVIDIGDEKIALCFFCYDSITIPEGKIFGEGVGEINETN